MPDNRSHIDQTTIIDLHTAAYGTFRDKMAVVPNDRRFPRANSATIWDETAQFCPENRMPCDCKVDWFILPRGWLSKGFERRYDSGVVPDTQRRRSFGLPVAPGGAGYLRPLCSPQHGENRSTLRRFGSWMTRAAVVSFLNRLRPITASTKRYVPSALKGVACTISPSSLAIGRPRYARWSVGFVPKCKLARSPFCATAPGATPAAASSPSQPSQRRQSSPMCAP